jgi:hypothetical protein
MQAAVMEALGLGDNAPYLDVSQLCQGLVKAFAHFVQTRRTHSLAGMPKHGPELYLRVWNQIHTLGDKPLHDRGVFDSLGEMAHPGLISAVPRKRRTGAPSLNVRTALLGVLQFGCLNGLRRRTPARLLTDEDLSIGSL